MSFLKSLQDSWETLAAPIDTATREKGWLGIAIIAVLGVAISKLLSQIINIFLWRHLEKMPLLKTVPFKESDKDLVLPIQLTLLGWICLLGLAIFKIDATILRNLEIAVKTLTYFGLMLGCWRIADIISVIMSHQAAKTDTKFDDLLVPLINRTLKVIVVTMGLVSVAEILKFPISSLLAGLGIGGLAVAMAAKDTIANVFGSLTVIVDRPFHIGDSVLIDGKEEGTVERLGFRSTRIRTFNDSLLVVPNSKLINASIDNYGARTYRRFKTTIGITYDTHPDKIEAFCEGVKTLFENHPNTRKDNFYVSLNDFADSSLSIFLSVFLKVPDRATELKDRHTLLLEIIRLADSLGVEFAFPTRTLHIQNTPDTIKTL